MLYEEFDRQEIQCLAQLETILYSYATLPATYWLGVLLVLLTASILLRLER